MLKKFNCLVENLHSEAAYEFRVSTISLKDGTRSLPSETSEIIRLRLIGGNYLASPDFTTKLPPQRPQLPEYLDFDEGDCSSLTLCWLPAQSVLPVLVCLLND